MIMSWSVEKKATVVSLKLTPAFILGMAEKNNYIGYQTKV